MIYGLPGQTLEEWQENLDDAIHLEIPHISAYHLIYEEGTALYKLMEAGKVAPIEEELSVTLFSTLINRLAEAGYLHYEISNFARPGYFPSITAPIGPAKNISVSGLPPTPMMEKADNGTSLPFPTT